MYSLTLALASAVAGLASAQMSMMPGMEMGGMEGMFDMSSVAPACMDICMPMVQLTEECDPNMMIMGKEGGAANVDCVCKNESFDVAVIGGLCSSCLMMNGKGGNMELDRLSSTCSFEAAIYAPSATALLNGGVTVMATAPTGTFVPSRTGSGSMAGMTGMNAAPALSGMGLEFAAAGALAAGFVGGMI
ncbi:hypothetical protein K402DRAFT_408485 [Aulographum hederae CBS 113979]|uniref:Extracellular membrane protein CFEM domain-containing protein n=1 Tax=Aulographum hederae CBS 113979 TaxID=1176131 RepID=A0A6G1GKP0_9PEZI|nr:hypothetical protein K402DRAFT_408485 [Aulographum hederae CBS 113979]